jgi:hypothetical protein
MRSTVEQRTPARQGYRLKSLNWNHSSQMVCPNGSPKLGLTRCVRMGARLIPGLVEQRPNGAQWRWRRTDEIYKDCGYVVLVNENWTWTSLRSSAWPEEAGSEGAATKVTEKTVRKPPKRDDRPQSGESAKTTAVVKLIGRNGTEFPSNRS